MKITITNCTGLIFRGRQSQYFDKKTMSFNYKETFTLLKRESCNCKNCAMLIEDIQLNGDVMVDCTYWFKTFNHGEIENGAKYKLVVQSWDCEFEDYTEESYCYPDEVIMEKIK